MYANGGGSQDGCGGGEPAALIWTATLRDGKRVHSQDVDARFPQPFGRYTLRERVGRGGMAEVFRATLPGFGGFEKQVAIKRMFRDFAHDPAFVEMLSDEAKIVSQLAHPNIVQILDIGRVGDDYYIAFEFIEGVDLFSVLQRHHEEGIDLPVGLACHIVAELCSALDYAHVRRTADGNPLGIVHRDVSPQNVLLSLQGEVKLTDFGIAKAAYRYTQTQAGMIKGKVYYMSPEQVLGHDLDHRADIFAAGILLFESLTTRPLYDEADHKRLLEKVSHADYSWPPDKAGRVPPALRAIVEKALRARADDRYQSGREMRDGLIAASRDLGLWWEREELGAYLRNMYGIAEDRPPDMIAHNRLIHPERHDERWNSRVDVRAAVADEGDEPTWRDPAQPPRLPPRPGQPTAEPMRPPVVTVPARLAADGVGAALAQTARARPGVARQAPSSPGVPPPLPAAPRADVDVAPAAPAPPPIPSAQSAAKADDPNEATAELSLPLAAALLSVGRPGPAAPVPTAAGVTGAAPAPTGSPPGVVVRTPMPAAPPATPAEAGRLLSAGRAPTPPPHGRPAPLRPPPAKRPSGASVVVRPPVERPPTGVNPVRPAPHEDSTFQMDQAELQRRLAEQPAVMPEPDAATRSMDAIVEDFDDTTKPQTARQVDLSSVRTHPLTSAETADDDELPATTGLLLATAVVWVGAVTLAVYATLITRS